ncbi:hypothetical protein KVT40_006998 [Elsinoe batatas]|uniref:Carboxylesterase type B domain-containing protein n=1 Tax=Elsinoe batatas TaxID=2601811 RepID=A0A8K0PE57_9PEZI|nr:hypothetical protein KVT40_006998 [Elsinoe batatas]
MSIAAPSLNETNELQYLRYHPELGPIVGCKISSELVQFRSLQYASIPQRFARSVVRTGLPDQGKENLGGYNAFEHGPSSIQPVNSVETDVKWNQLPPEAIGIPQTQSEDCLRLTLTVPNEALETSSKKLPVVVFIHGGAFMVASGERAYYDPTKLCMDALDTKQPIIFASMNYTLNALGFMHSPEAANILPANNGLHDQIHAFEWLQRFLPGFGGNIDQITAIGQSAGAASLSLHNSVPRAAPLYRRSIVLSGSSVVLVTMTPEQHQAEFLHQAEKLGIVTFNRSSHDIALDIIHLPVDRIRELDMPGAPCSGTDLIPSQDWATMAHARYSVPNPWLESQVLSSCTFDGSISYMVALSQTRKNLAATFQAICNNRLKDPTRLLDIYNITTADSDPEALEKICQIVTDIGFFNAAVSHAKGAQLCSSPTPTYLQLFDLPNPFAGLLPSHRFATHTWDIVALLGAFDHLVPPNDLEVIKSWRHRILAYVRTGAWPCPAWDPEKLSTLHVGKEGLRCPGREEMADHRASKLMEYAETQGGEGGADVLWEDVVRFFLKTGNPRYAHEAEALLGSDGG